MTNTLTTNVKDTIKQIQSLEDAGADIVRVSCPDKDSTKSLKKIQVAYFDEIIGSSRSIDTIYYLISKTSEVLHNTI